MFKKKVLKLILILLCLAILPVSCIQKGKEPVGNLKLTTIAHSVLYAPLYITQSQGFFADEKLDVSINTISSNDELIGSLRENETDIILAGPQSTITKGRDSEEGLINFAQLIKRDTSYLLAREPQSNFKWQDLNKKIIIGGVNNSTPQLMLEYLLISNDLQPFKKIDIIHNIPPEAIVGAFKGGVGDYIHLLEPQVSILEKQKKGFVVAALGDYLGEISYTNFITSTAMLKKRPQVAQKFVNALYKGQLWCKYHSAEEISQALLPYFPDLDQDILFSIVNRYKLQNTWTENPIIKEADFRKIQEIFIQSGLFTAEINFSSVVDNSWAEKAVDQIPVPKEYQKKE